MRNVYRITVKYSKEKTAELHFDKQDSANIFVKAMQAMLTKTGKDEVEFEATTLRVFEEDEEIASEMIEAINIASTLTDDGVDLHDFLEENE